MGPPQMTRNKTRIKCCQDPTEQPAENEKAKLARRISTRSTATTAHQFESINFLMETILVCHRQKWEDFSHHQTMDTQENETEGMFMSDASKYTDSPPPPEYRYSTHLHFWANHEPVDVFIFTITGSLLLIHDLKPDTIWLPSTKWKPQK